MSLLNDLSKNVIINFMDKTGEFLAETPKDREPAWMEYGSGRSGDCRKDRGSAAGTVYPCESAP